MSANNGDKSRHNRLRKRGIAKRLLLKEMFKPAAAVDANSTPAPSPKSSAKKGR
jgi:hypothetical protein